MPPIIMFVLAHLAGVFFIFGGVILVAGIGGPVDWSGLFLGLIGAGLIFGAWADPLWNPWHRMWDK